MKFAIATLFAYLSLTALHLRAQDLPDPANPGYVDFGELAAAYGEPRVMINIGSSLLRLVNAIQHEDPATEAVLQNMESIHVNVYDTHGNLDPAVERMDSVRRGLSADAWEPIVRAREEGEHVEIFVKQDAVSIRGLAVMAVNGEEAVFINVLGSINPEQLATVMATMDLDVDLDL